MIKTNIIIIGTSGLTKDVIDIIEKENKYKIVGLVSSNIQVGNVFLKYKILGSETDLPLLSETYLFNLGVITISDNYIRKQMHYKIKKLIPGLKFISAIHPSAVIGKNVKIGKGCIIMANVIINSDSIISPFCNINTRSSVGHESKLKKYTSLGINCTIGGKVEIGSYSSINQSANIIQGIIIGKHTTVSANSLVLKNISDNKLVYGIPAKTV